MRKSPLSHQLLPGSFLEALVELHKLVYIMGEEVMVNKTSIQNKFY